MKKVKVRLNRKGTKLGVNHILSLTIDAFRQMVGDVAVLVLSTGANNARVDTLRVLASLLCWALAVCTATHTCDGFIRRCAEMSIEVML